MKRLKYALSLGLAASIFLTAYFYFKENISTDVLLVTAVFIFILMTIISYFKIFSQVNNDEIKFQELNNVVYSGRANHYVDGITVGGSLYLADNQIVFKTNALNYLQKHECIINIEDVTAIESEKTLGLINNGLLIRTKNGSEQFVVTNRDVWINEIEKSAKNI